MQSQAVRESIDKEKLIAIIRGVDPGKVVEVAGALCRGGIRMVEVTLDHSSEEAREAALQSVRLISRELSARVLVGAGTVLSSAQVDQAVDAGALYIVSPDANPEVIRRTRQRGAVSVPGAFTPTEIAAAHAAGADYVKLFPAGVLGADYVKAIRAPLAHIPLLAVGGIEPANIPSFLKAGVVGFGIGSNLVDKKLVQEGRFDQLETLTRSFVQAVRES